MATTLGNAYVQIVPSAKGIGGTMSKALNGEAASAGASAGNNIAGSIKGAMIAAGIGAALVKSIKSGAALEQSIGGIETLFKKNADTVIKYADNAYKTAGLSANEYMETATSFSASLLQSLGGDTKKASQYTNMAITDMSDNANKMGTDMQRIQDAYQGFAKQNYTMLDNLKLGYGGTKTEMQRLLKDATKLSGQKYDIENLNDVYDAIHVIQNEMGITGTTAKEAASTLSGSFGSMKSAAENLMANLTLGRKIGPSMVALAETASTFLFNNLIPAIGRIIASLPEAIGAMVKTGIPHIVNSGKEMVQGLIDGMSGANAEMISSGANAVASYILGIVGKIPSLITAGGAMLSTLLSKISERLPEMLNSGVKFISAFVSGILRKIPDIIDAYAKVFGKIAPQIQKNLPVVAAAAGKLIGRLAIGIIRNLPKIVAALVKLSAVILKSLIQMIPTLIKTGGKLIAGLAKGMGGNVLSKVKSAGTRAKNAILRPIESAKNMIARIINKIKSMFNIVLKFRGIKLPHISVSWNRSGNLAKIATKLGLPGVPDFGVNWYKTGGIFNDPSIIGVGEAGGEAVLPLTQLWSRFDMMADSIVNGVSTIVSGGNQGAGGDITLKIYLYPNGPKMGEQIVKAYDTYKRRL